LLFVESGVINCANAFPVKKRKNRRSRYFMGMSKVENAPWRW
jgi:hypothetical protein